jgi:hypothetical protein
MSKKGCAPQSHTQHLVETAVPKTLSKTTLVQIADQIRTGKQIPAELVEPFLSHAFAETSPFSRFMLKVAAYISLFFASVLVIFPEVGESLIAILPSFFLLPERIAKALDYVWGLVGKPVGKQHLMYHLPNIIIYAFGVAGIRQLWRRLNKNNWRDRVENAQEMLEKTVADGSLRVTFPPGFSLLFAGEGDQMARSLVADDALIGPTLQVQRPSYTPLWGRFATDEGYDAFQRVLAQFNSEKAGEYVLFPVVDEHLFLPGANEFDMAPHRVEIAVRRIREHEQRAGWARKTVIIVGDREHRSAFVTASRDGREEDAKDIVSLATIEADHEDVIVADPTEITLRRIIELADGRRILFRASDIGVEKYAADFYQRLALLGHDPNRQGALIIGYDISDLETEHQIVAKAHFDYLPVILSRDVFEQLSERYLRDGGYIFVPDLVKAELQRLVSR